MSANISNDEKVSIPQAVSAVATISSLAEIKIANIVSIPQAVSAVATVATFAEQTPHHYVSIPQAVSAVATHGVVYQSLRIE